MFSSRLTIFVALAVGIPSWAWCAGPHDDPFAETTATSEPHADHGANAHEHNDARGHAESPSGEAHGHGDEHGDGGDGKVEIPEAAQRAAGIEVKVATSQNVAATVTAPGEVRFDAYRTSKVTPRLSAQIIQRFAKLGDNVSAGQRLASLSSVDMAEAQGQMLVAAREWGRVQKLGEQTVSEKRYGEAKIAHQQARAKLLSYGLPEAQLAALLRSDDAALAAGTFDVLAPRAGAVTSDDFIEGEFVEPGRVLFEIADASHLWVESRMSPNDATDIAPGSKATVLTKDGAVFAGTVLQVFRQVDESTRTVGVRIGVSDAKGALRPGTFVQTRLAGAGSVTAFVLPQPAVVRTPDGDWGVYVESEPGRFALTEVQWVREADGHVIVTGLPPGSRVVTQGAFFIQSEQAKAGFDPHNH